ncbi:MAG: metal ABC transporter solute-binding protein, Zn/Mn family [Acidimicrobiales bacterium]
MSVVVLAILTWALAACGPGAASRDGMTAAGSRGATTSADAGAVIRVAAAENFWGSIASQIGGEHAHVVSIITNPNTDPHAYEPTAADARVLAQSQLVIENGVGYDPWVPKLLSADGGSVTTLDVGSRLGLVDGDNPHRWYDPDDVRVVIGQLVADYRKLDPADSAYFGRQEARFDTIALKPYDSVIAAIKARYSGTPVGASESIFALLAPSLGLDLVTPPSFLRAISEGTDVSVTDKETIDNQIRNHLIRIYVYNSQNVTPDIQVQLNQVKAEHIPYATITETLQPANASYQAWQTKQLVGIESALAAAGAHG